ncbi:MAG TPA: hypothetical protein PK461_13565, partial [Alcaligenes faecalis]|nr:hypothetical protein [Alcaligenes faecalis]
MDHRTPNIVTTRGGQQQQKKKKKTTAAQKGNTSYSQRTLRGKSTKRSAITRQIDNGLMRE